ncbi:restriction endonuclease subunit S [Micrococcus luteus]|nr:restriction endonuclease subunit S [Micrococcus luteus]
MRKGWHEARFTDLVSVTKGRKPRSTRGDSAPNAYEYLTATRLRSGQASEWVEDSTAVVTATEDDTLIIWDGAGVGDVFRGAGGVVASTMARLRPSVKSVSSEYLQLLAQEISPILKASPRGSTVPHVDPNILARIVVSIPPYSEQNRIVDLMGALDATITTTDESLRSLRSAQRAFSAGLHSRANLEDWEESNLADVLGGPGAIRTGPFGSQLHQSDYVDDGPVAVVMPANMRSHRVDLAGIARISERDGDRLNRHRTQEGDILWSRRGDVARFAVIDNESTESLCGTGCFLLRPHDASTTQWLEPWLASPQVGWWLEENAVGATMKNLNRTILSGVPVRVPPVEVRAHTARAWVSLVASSAAVERTRERLTDLRSNLLAALLSGEHAIPESYDELLEVTA